MRLHYEGRLPSGHVFESSRDRGRAFQFRLGAGQVIRGMEFAVAQLTRGCRARFRVPPELAYGAAGRLPKVPPNTPLEFEVQIIDFFSPDGECGAWYRCARRGARAGPSLRHSRNRAAVGQSPAVRARARSPRNAPRRRSGLDAS